MQDKLIDMDTAILAKEKGFNEGCSWFYGIYEGYSGMHLVDNYNKSNDPEEYSVCTQSLLQKWLREKHQIDIWVEKFPDDERFFPQCPQLILLNGIDTFFTYEEALEAILRKALTLIK